MPFRYRITSKILSITRDQKCNERSRFVSHNKKKYWARAYGKCFGHQNEIWNQLAWSLTRVLLQKFLFNASLYNKKKYNTTYTIWRWRWFSMYLSHFLNKNMSVLHVMINNLNEIFKFHFSIKTFIDFFFQFSVSVSFSLLSNSAEKMKKKNKNTYFNN